MTIRLTHLLVLAFWIAGFATVRVQAQLVPVLSATITNPNPETLDYFGFAIAPVASNHIVIGARKDNTADTAQTGVAYVFNANGVLLTTITNPTPANLDYFGFALAGIGPNHILIADIQDDTGDDDAGAVYLFNLEGSRVATFLNPTPIDGEHFGFSVAPLGVDRVIIGTLPFGPGVAYLFSTNGTLLRTFPNPTPSTFDDFGSDVAAVGSHAILIGAQRDDLGAADAGAAYLFDTNAALVTTFTNPAPNVDDRFGGTVAAVGAAQVIIGAMSADTGAQDAGVAYLFSTNGALLHTFTNPAPAIGDSFGNAISAVGEDKVLISASFKDSGASNAGIAYLFSTNGALLATITNPAPTIDDRFGNSVAALGTNHIAIGASQNDAGARDSGAAYVFSLSAPAAPRLGIEALSNGTIRLAWPLDAMGFVLESTPALAPPPGTSSWTMVSFPYETNASEISVTLSLLGSEFFRLRN